MSGFVDHCALARHTAPRNELSDVGSVLSICRCASVYNWPHLKVLDMTLCTRVFSNQPFTTRLLNFRLNILYIQR